MAIEVLTTKLYSPQVMDTLVDRPRLIDRFARDIQRGFVLVSAPAGFGKTTLIAQWLVSESVQAAWLSLDRQDSDPNRFLVYMIHALRSVVDVGESILQTLSSGGNADLESRITNKLPPKVFRLADFEK